ncbi:hypothetical protein [Pinibacter aurantiacus]|uniref:Neutral/alkaline non-lysosomal ceramidase N-terminal domain-containing protein n=1 Tax=Pinibacter aurantiacus TaxID=2851599 RepID=A0A9E2W6C6_9BACT|nr:hypothetical protein [Pinibacter aurantiacus]MBV4359688.1 hypothetical protein [Pinibacter aurantiacus]
MRLLIRAFVFGSLVLNMSMLSQAQKVAVKSGVAQANITPPVGCRLAGHFYEIISTGIHDSLWAKAIVLQQGNEKYAFVFCDLIGITTDISSKARTMASERTRIPISHIIVAATHSHTGPLFYGFQRNYFHDKALQKGGDPHEKNDYPAFLEEQIASAVTNANASMTTVKLEVLIGTENFSHNRRYHMKDGTVMFNPGPLNPNIVSPAGPVDPDVEMLMVRDAKSNNALSGLTVFGMHADCVGGTDIGADYPYYLEQSLKAYFGKNYFSAFGLGPCGDVNHIDVTKDLPIYDSVYPQQFGKALASTVIGNVSKMKTVKAPALAMLSQKVLLPLQVPTQQQVDSARIIINGLYEAKETGAYVKNAGGEAGDFLKRVEMSKYLNLAQRRQTIEEEVQVLRIDNETAIVGLPGEIFAELGLSIKRASPFKNTIVITVCNNRTSYIPTRKAFAEGSYEVTNSIVMPGSGEMLVDTAIALLRKLKPAH